MNWRFRDALYYFTSVTLSAFAFRCWHGIARSPATRDYHSCCIGRRRSRKMFARHFFALALLHPLVSPAGNQGVQRIRDMQWNFQHTQRGGITKLKELRDLPFGHQCCVIRLLHAARLYSGVHVVQLGGGAGHPPAASSRPSPAQLRQVAS
jgi:hypothetical protein